MLKLQRSVNVLVLTCACFVLHRHAAASNIISVDENGHGTFNGTNLTFTSVLPFNPLIYNLPSVVTPGQVVLMAIETISGVVGIFPSDIITFDNSPTSGLGRLSFISFPQTSGPGDLADLSAFPLPPYPNALQIFEVGPEGANGAVYTPLTGQPGFMTGTVTYNITSDAPESGTFVLLALGLGLAIAKQGHGLPKLTL